MPIYRRYYGVPVYRAQKVAEEVVPLCVLMVSTVNSTNFARHAGVNYSQYGGAALTDKMHIGILSKKVDSAAAGQSQVSPALIGQIGIGEHRLDLAVQRKRTVESAARRRRNIGRCRTGGDGAQTGQGSDDEQAFQK